ncbi:MAG: hypothetical protein CO030_01640 [Candidatus Magasanikbacteria bacterium CG_4_9_14_0_2_um_filter_42_11]|uniref:Polysaccharide chain length determinant N-terminal domain-containing protein n=1 Tax=Candidatus Magasanikbacteria bacterium CG_4_9_14_0_2_um_filter_42_11 TaxID=1974643 RepID=A0A2M8FAB0_9BACT|nr:MAG: hypothetical protein COU34_03820 [Candidatus Magasanikbacteria bacterium CG10_big_fil_rev_8_21_14_0_10_43_9]PIY92118.1 MAG: hypothetical protein COY70_04975 [Candidatus Magasanikbacteria bacterium CG_4_10_14_0_8_um_filter_42_12]PJC52674.1 MAG: hypothetical protein CO030_01640 [Candidatus Magasanikbacteria bacterium CG_4_9_14_0_2_um_filter_42_11]
MHHSPLSRILQGSKILLALGFVTAVLAAGATFLFPLEYRADASVLIISKSRYGVDPYTVVKSAERVGENIAQIIGTDDFYDKVKVQEGYSVDWNVFDSLDSREKRKEWNKHVQGAVVYGTGVLNISAYSTEPKQAMALAGAASDTLVSKGWQYIGGDVTLQVVNHPVVTTWPVRPNFFTNAVLGFVVGLLLGSLIVVRK